MRCARQSNSRTDIESTTEIWDEPLPYNRVMQLDGRTVLVTGGASGLGGATVDMIVAAGGRAVIADINDEAGRTKAAAHGNRVRYVKADVTSETEMQRAVDTAVRELGGLHGLVSAAGVAVAERV